MLQELRRQNYEAQSLEKSGIQARTGLLAPDLEKLGILGVTDKTRRRPGDVSIKSRSFRRGLAIDLALICPLAVSSREGGTLRVIRSTSENRPLC